MYYGFFCTLMLWCHPCIKMIDVENIYANLVKWWLSFIKHWYHNTYKTVWSQELETTKSIKSQGTRSEGIAKKANTNWEAKESETVQDQEAGNADTTQCNSYDKAWNPVGSFARQEQGPRNFSPMYFLPDLISPKSPLQLPHASNISMLFLLLCLQSLFPKTPLPHLPNITPSIFHSVS